MFIRLTIYFKEDAPINILTTQQNINDAIYAIKITNYFIITGVHGDAFIIPEHRIASMYYAPIPAGQNENKQSESEGEKSIEPSEE